MNSPKRTTRSRKRRSHMKESDIQFALYELDAWERSERSDHLTWEALERVSGFTRQTLYSKQAIKTRYEEVKAALRKGVTHHQDPMRRMLEQRIEALEKENTALKRQIDHWLELWARYEYNAKVHGIDPELLRQPLLELNRK